VRLRLLDEKLSDVVEFRKAKWPIPWSNARLSGFDNDTVKAFEIVGVPKVVLIGVCLRSGRSTLTGLPTATHAVAMRSL
jgi:hypothetical protein